MSETLAWCGLLVYFRNPVYRSNVPLNRVSSTVLIFVVNGQKVGGGGGQNAYGLVNLGSLDYKTLYQNWIFQYMGVYIHGKTCTCTLLRNEDLRAPPTSPNPTNPTTPTHPSTPTPHPKSHFKLSAVNADAWCKTTFTVSQKDSGAPPTATNHHIVTP